MQPVQHPDTIDVHVHEHAPESPEIDNGPQEDTGYNPFQVPADLNMARKHGIAKRVYALKPERKYNEVEPEVCPCCGLATKGDLIPLTAGVSSFYHLGSGYPLYFRFIKYAIAMLLAMLLVSGIYNLVTNVVQGDCTSQDSTAPYTYCIKGYILSFTLANKRENKDFLTAQLALNLATVIVIMVFFHYLRYQFRKTEIAADDATVTPSDYTIEIENIDADACNSEIKQWLMTFATPEQPIEVERIVRPYAINKYIEVVNKISNLKTQRNTITHSGQALNSEQQTRIQTIDTEVQTLETQVNQLKKEGLKKATLIFVTFRKAEQAVFIASKFKRPLIAEVLGFLVSTVYNTSHTFKGQRVHVRRAPEPTDVLWPNLGYTKQERNRTRILSNSITLFMIILSFAIIILVNWGQSEAVKHYGKESGVVQGLSIIASLVIVVTNSLLAMLIDFLAKYEKHYTFTHYLRGVAQKLAIAQFLNTALTNLFAELILSQNNSEQEKAENGFQDVNIYAKGGLLENMYWVFITNAFLTPVLAIFDPIYIMKRGFQWLAERKEKKGEKSTMNQKAAHILYEGPVMAMPTKYAGMIKIVLLATFYAPAIPFSLIYTIPGLALWYWADKYTLLRRNALPNAIDDDLADAMVEYLEWAAATFACGNILYVFTLKDQFDEFAFNDTAKSLVWITLGISLFHIIFPMEALNQKLFPIEDLVTETQTFEEARLGFPTDYDIENPLTHAKALRDYFKRLKSSASMAKSAQVKKMVDTGIFSKLKAENFEAILTPTGNTTIKQQDPDEDEIDFGGLDDYAAQVEKQKVNATPNGNVEQGPSLGNFFTRLDQNQVNGGEALKNLFGKLPDADVEAEPLNGGEKPRRQDSNHQDVNDQDVNNIVGMFGGFGGNMMNKEVYQDDEPVNIKEGEDLNTFFGGNTSNHNQGHEDQAIGGIQLFNSRLPERQKTTESEQRSHRPLVHQDSSNINSKEHNEDTSPINRSLTVSRRIIPKEMHQN